MEWSELLGIDYVLLHSRVFGYGWSIKDAIERPLNKTHGEDYVYVNYFGEEKSLVEISRETGISYKALMNRYKKGISIEDEVKKYRENGNRFIQRYSYNGKSLTIPEWSKEIGVPKQTLEYRLRVGKSYDKVFTTKKHIYSKRKSKKAEE